ncbi:MAG: hypothetical protein IH623_22970 [Verrucomicrobia bacterium]|nr:hypothetical protein [Verrucomicrobiota bacterium]
MNETGTKAGIQSLSYIERFYADYRRDPDSVSAEWRTFFAKSEKGDGEADGAAELVPSFKPRSVFNPVAPVESSRTGFELDPRVASLGDRLYRLVRNHRVRGHIIAAVDPLGRARPCPPELKLETYGFTESELDLPTNLPTLHFDAPLTIRQIFQRLRNTYCRSIGVQFMHIDDLAV